MCGILGMIGDRWLGDFDKALDSIQSRGPDASGTYHFQDIHLGHRRLSVIDLEHGQQPMSSQDGRYTLVYNGEIYNFRELKDELKEMGISIDTHSDTHVLLEALMFWGVEKTLPKLDGMFAFGLWDAHEQTLTMARDRFGIKPLFYSIVEGLVFGSTMQPFWELGGFPRYLNFEAMRDYLASQTIYSPMTILREVKSLEPGCYVVWRRNEPKTIDVKRFWDIPNPNTVEKMDFEELVARTEAAVDTSVKRQMVSDVPLGAFLSGGIDSSLMVHYMAKHSAKPLKTFCMKFGDAHPKYDESRYAQMVADKYGCEHTVLESKSVSGVFFEEVVSSMGQPIADPALLPTAVLSQEIKKHVTVAISGDGGDELFGGYGRYLRTSEIYPDQWQKKMLRMLCDKGCLPKSLYRKGLTRSEMVMWERVALGPFAKTRKDMKAYVGREYHDRLKVDDTMRLWKELLGRWGGDASVDAMMRADIWTYLSENCLVKTDRASMSCGLEVRVPLLGNPVADMILPVGADLKLAHGCKGALITLAKERLPREVWDREKHGFSVPLRDYFLSDWQDVIDSWVNEIETLAPFMNSQRLQKQWLKMKKLGRGNARLMYTLVVLLGWLKTHPVDWD